MSTKKAKGYGFVYVPCTINEIVTKEISNKTDIDFTNTNIHHRYLVKNPNIDFIKRDGARDGSICVVDDKGGLRFYSPIRNMCLLIIDNDEILQFKENNEWVSIYTFLVSEHSGGGGGGSGSAFPEAPNNNKIYGRKNRSWVEVKSPIEEDAPQDTFLYARSNGSWIKINNLSDVPNPTKKYLRKQGTWEEFKEDEFVKEANNDGKLYARKNGGWESVVSFPEAPNDTFSYVRKGNNWVKETKPIEIDAPSDNSSYGRKDGNWEKINEFPEAPNDNATYVRKNKTWVRETIDTDAPNDGKQYVRKNESWVHLDTAGTILEAENDGKVYGRKSKDWTDLDTLFIRDVIDTKKYIRSKTNWVEFDPDNYVAKNGLTDNKLYALKNDALTSFDPFVDANSDTKYYARKDGSWEALDDTFIKEANNDSKNYGRNNKAWVDLDTVYIKDVNDTKKYLKTQSNWVEFEPNDYLAKNKLNDGKLYCIKNDVLTEFTAFTDAPSDTKLYGRKDGNWEEVTVSAGGIGEAPNDGKYYLRKENNWVGISGDNISGIDTQNYIGFNITGEMVPLDDYFVSDLHTEPEGLYVRKKENGSNGGSWVKFDETKYLKKENNLIINVGLDGDDNNDATGKVRTLARAVELIPDFSPNTVKIILEAGTYDIDNTIVIGPNVTPIISIESINNDVTLNFNNINIDDFIRVFGVNYFILKNIKLTHSPAKAPTKNWIRLAKVATTLIQDVTITETTSNSISRGILAGEGSCDIERCIINGCNIGITAGTTSVVTLDNVSGNNKKYGYSSYGVLKAKNNTTITGETAKSNKENSGVIFDGRTTILTPSNIVVGDYEIFVSTVGNDNNDGTEANPVKTIYKAIELLPEFSNGKVRIKCEAGTYNIDKTITFISKMLPSLFIESKSGLKDVTFKVVNELRNVIYVDNVSFFNLYNITLTNEIGKKILENWIFIGRSYSFIYNVIINDVEPSSESNGIIVSGFSDIENTEINTNLGVFVGRSGFVTLTNVSGNNKTYGYVTAGLIKKRYIVPLTGQIAPYSIDSGGEIVETNRNDDIISFYVSNSGNDNTGNGTKNKPFRNISKCFASLFYKDWDTVNIIFENNYSIIEHINIGAYNNFKSIKNLIFKGEGPEGVKRNITIVAGGNATNKSTLNINESVEDVYFIDLIITKAITANENIYKLVTLNKIDKAFFINCDINDFNNVNNVPIETSNGTRTVIDGVNFLRCKAMINAQKLSDVFVRNCNLNVVERPAILDGCVLYKNNVTGWNNNSTLISGAEIRG